MKKISLILSVVMVMATVLSHSSISLVTASDSSDSYAVEEYSTEQFAAYRSGDVYTAPTKEGVLFAGWYYDKTCEQNVGQDVKTSNQNVYAKFVPETVLGVKAQVSANLTDGNASNDKTAHMRFVTSIDSLRYSNIGFQMSYNKIASCLTNMNDNFDDNSIFTWESNGTGEVAVTEEESKLPMGGSGKALNVKCPTQYDGCIIKPLSGTLLSGRKYTISFDMKGNALPSNDVVIYVQSGTNFEQRNVYDNSDKRVEVTLETQADYIQIFTSVAGLEFTIDNFSITTGVSENFNDFDSLSVNIAANNSGVFQKTTNIPESGSGNGLYFKCPNQFDGIQIDPSKSLPLGDTYEVATKYKVLANPNNSILYVQYGTNYQQVEMQEGTEGEFKVQLTAQNTDVLQMFSSAAGLELVIDDLTIKRYEEVMIDKQVAATGKVYPTLYANVLDSSSGIMEYYPNQEFCSISKYFKTYTVTDIPKDSYNTNFTVTPFWVTKDGTTVEGETVTKTVNQGVEAAIPTSILENFDNFNALSVDVGANGAGTFEETTNVPSAGLGSGLLVKCPAQYDGVCITPKQTLAQGYTYQITAKYKVMANPNNSILYVQYGTNYQQVEMQEGTEGEFKVQLVAQDTDVLQMFCSAAGLEVVLDDLRIERLEVTQ